MKRVLLSLCRYVTLRLSCCVTLPQTTTKLYITDVTFQESPRGYERLYKFYSEDLYGKRPALQKIIAVALHHDNQTDPVPGIKQDFSEFKYSKIFKRSQS